MVSPLTQILNRAEALCRCGASSFAQLARDMKEPRQRVYEWLSIRDRKPTGETAIKLLEWTAKKQNEIGHRTKLGAAYRKSFRELQQKHSKPQEN